MYKTRGYPIDRELRRASTARRASPFQPTVRALARRLQRMVGLGSPSPQSASAAHDDTPTSRSDSANDRGRRYLIQTIPPAERGLYGAGEVNCEPC